MGTARRSRRSRGVLQKVAASVAYRQRTGLRMIPQSPPGLRFIDGEPCYSADRLNRPPDTKLGRPGVE